MIDVDWFGAGWAVYKGDVRDSEFFPPLNDMEAQRWWLGGVRGGVGGRPRRRGGRVGAPWGRDG
jgi:hypothetical protein